ncbi:MAG: hypothetical protein Q4C35_00460 [Eubacteriales bacterium]|nr:hypothetical protein [Eubacteriales bacterium]
MSKELLEAMPDVLDVSQLAGVLHLSRSGAYSLHSTPLFLLRLFEIYACSALK